MCVVCVASEGGLVRGFLIKQNANTRCYIYIQCMCPPLSEFDTVLIKLVDGWLHIQQSGDGVCTDTGRGGHSR